MQQKIVTKFKLQFSMVHRALNISISAFNKLPMWHIEATSSAEFNIFVQKNVSSYLHTMDSYEE